MPGGVAKEGLKTKGSVVDAAGKALERILTLGRIGAGIASIRRWANPENVRGRPKPQAAERERDQNETAPLLPALNRIS